MPLFIVENDITKMDTDCIVISADVSLKPTGGMSSALYDAVAEPKRLAKECGYIGFCGGCDCVTTNSYGLPSKYVIHSVAPVCADSKGRAEEYLKDCYKNAVFMARRKMFDSLSVPLIGTGKKGYSKEVSLKIAVEAISEFLKKYDMNISLVVHKKSSFKPNPSLVEKVSNYIADNYRGSSSFNSFGDLTAEFSYTDSSESELIFSGAEKCIEKPEIEKNEPNNAPSVSFPALLKNTLKKYKIKESKLYRSANIEKFAYARLKNNEEKPPKKEAVLALALAMRLSPAAAEDFIEQSGYSLSSSSRQDVIVKYFLENQDYNIHTVNQMLFYFDEQQLGALI